MKTFTWQAVIALTVVLASLVVIYNNTSDLDTRKQLLGYVETVLAFFVGAAAGGAVAGIVGYFKGKNMI
jgi:hypothetical protein